MKFAMKRDMVKAGLQTNKMIKEKTMKSGITGKILWVNLSNGTKEVLKPEQDLYQQFLGGYGIGV